MKKTLTTTLGSLAVITALALTGCTSAEPGPVETTSSSAKPPIPEVTTPAPAGDVKTVPANKEDTVATGILAYQDYLTVYAQILSDGGTNPERIFDVASAAGGQVVQSAVSMKKMGQRSTGEFKFTVLSSNIGAGSGSDGKELGPFTQAVLDVCIDATALKDFSADGQSVPRKGPQKITKSITTQWTPEQKRWIVVFDKLPEEKVTPC